MVRRRTSPKQRFSMADAPIALVRGEAVARDQSVEGPHEVVSGHLGDDRGSRDAEAVLVALEHRRLTILVGPERKSIHQHVIRCAPEGA